MRILSGVAIIYDLVLCPDCEKRLIKHLYLPLDLLALFFPRLCYHFWAAARAAAEMQRRPRSSGVTSPGAGFQGTPRDGGENLAELRAKLSGY